eukprot:CAMPEP_0178554476 /NCGR_PEP_ID=MMETSP0697-20121206/8353_1 /TAXON_ID=265572 /ORGANISM="Extubocellulus spinifer, Strain CCMP396" /LENGTH=661 /DNA_ID=CAMNT_0020187427 /DNA_START=46 /DNA_END=2031 /DNA_ORIENTATION=-
MSSETSGKSIAANDSATMSSEETSGKGEGKGEASNEKAEKAKALPRTSGYRVTRIESPSGRGCYYGQDLSHDDMEALTTRIVVGEYDTLQEAIEAARSERDGECRFDGWAEEHYGDDPPPYCSGDGENMDEDEDVTIRIDDIGEEVRAKEKEMAVARASEPPGKKQKQQQQQTQPQQQEQAKTNGGSTTVESKSSSGASSGTKKNYANYANGTKISKDFDGIPFVGEIISYDCEAKLYKIRYTDGDEEEMTNYEVKRRRVGSPKAVASKGSGMKKDTASSTKGKDAPSNGEDQLDASSTKEKDTPSGSNGEDKPGEAPEKPTASSSSSETSAPKPDKIRTFGPTTEESIPDENMFVRNPCRVEGGVQCLPSCYGTGAGSGKSSFAYCIQRLSDRNYAMRGLCLDGDGAKYTSFSRKNINTRCLAFIPETNLNDHAADETILDTCHLDMVNNNTGECLLTADNLIKAATPDLECIFLNGYQREGRSNERIDPNAIVKAIQTCKDNLKCFALTECVLTDEILAALASCKNLRGLTLYMTMYMTERWSGNGVTPATDAGLASVISSCPELRWLYVEEDRSGLFDDECWTALFNRSCPNLELLWVDSWKNTDCRRFVTRGSHPLIRSTLEARASSLKLCMITPDKHLKSRYVIGGSTETDRLSGV